MTDIQWPDVRKREREEGEEDDVAMNGRLGFTEHRNKRLHTLPLRTSPSQKPRAGPSSFSSNKIMTSTSSESDTKYMHHHQQPMPSIEMDQDAHMADDFSSSQYLQPGPSQPDHISSNIISGRMPTPIHCTFASQVRGSNWTTMPPGAVNSNATMLQNHGGMAPSPLNSHPDPSRPRILDGATDWSMVQNRRLPSPISENGCEDDLSSHGMVVDNCSPVMAQLQRPCLPHMPHSINPHAMMPIHPNIRMSPQPPDADAAMMDMDGGSPSSAPATPSPRGKYGHSRSKHTLNNWTLQPGMKRSFSIGYRADCEKCQQKIPGHFNHIIIS